jgi:hypothetical protein
VRGDEIFVLFVRFEYLLYIFSSEAGKKSVISFFNRANHFSWVCLFCNFVRNKIYVTEVKVLGPVVLVSKHKF